jgi:two-component system sensor histidine kinase PilS (NtrC family)
LADATTRDRDLGAGGDPGFDAYWRSLQYFSLYRLTVSAVFVVAFNLTVGAVNLGSQNPRLFESVAYSYVLIAYGLLFILRRWRRAFNIQLSAQVLIDVIVLTCLMYASGGAKSGIAIMLLVVVAGAGLVGQGRLTLFYAALATIALLMEQGVRMFRFGTETEDFFRTGITSLGFFATAIIAQLLARRAISNEALARRRGIELANQLKINQQVIRDMQDGVLVVDGAGQIRQHNPQAEALFGLLPDRMPTTLAGLSSELAGHWRRSRLDSEESELTLWVAGDRRPLRARLLPSGQGNTTLIYLEDLGRVQAQAQQIKLAALGRLTANIAHEIRNPLAAISHAAELLGEDQEKEARNRLVRIIGDNSLRLNRLVSEILELGRRDRVRPESVTLESFLRQFLDEYAVHDPKVRQRVELAAEGNIAVCFDRAHLHRIIENLLTNALRYATSNPAAIRLEVKSAPSSTGAEIHVLDDGPGIPEAQRSQVFEPFFTTHGSGTGLGLYIARELCDANGAQLELLETQAGGHFRIAIRGRECPTNAGPGPT